MGRGVVSVFYFYSDALSSTRGLTWCPSGSATEQVVEKVDYDAYGAPTITNWGPDRLFGTADDVTSTTSLVGNVNLFTGQTLDPETGNYYYRMRYYSPVTGRFLTQDPLGYVDGANMYAYVGNDPLNATDPMGLAAKANRGAGSQPRKKGAHEGRSYLGAFFGSIWGETEQLGSDMADGVATVFSDEIDDAYDTMIDQQANRIAKVIERENSMGQNGDVSAVAVMVGDVVGVTQVAEAGYGVDVGTAEELDDTERWSRGLQGGGQMLQFGAGVGAMGKSLRQGYQGSGWSQLKKWGTTYEGTGFKKAPPPGGKAPSTERPPAGVCFTTGTEVLTARGARKIEDIRVGDQVITATEPEGEETEVIPDTWRAITVQMPNPDGSHDVIEIEALRSLEWITAMHAVEGGTIYLRLEEMGLAGPAKVMSVKPCPTIEVSQGRVVTATLTHLNGFVMQLWFKGLKEPVEPTDSHPIYSEDEEDYVSARDLVEGELIRTRAGSVEIARIEWKPGIHRVYNLEVEGTQRYFVSPLQILSHNNPVNPCAAQTKPQAAKPPQCTRKIPKSKLKYAPKERGLAPIGEDGKPVELHHTDQAAGNASPREEMTRTDHRGAGNFKENHPNTGQSASAVDRGESSAQHRAHWQKEFDQGRFKGLRKQR